jgi:hypothetical protein
MPFVGVWQGCGRQLRDPHQPWKSDETGAHVGYRPQSRTNLFSRFQSRVSHSSGDTRTTTERMLTDITPRLSRGRIASS